MSSQFHSTVTASLRARVPASNYTLDCFVTNEFAYNEVLSRCLPASGTSGGYLGVGPCQNLIYTGALRPRVAIIADTRMDNLLEHLMFKVIFGWAPTPLDYLTLLFSRETTARQPDPLTAESLIAAFESCPVSAERYEQNRSRLISEAGTHWPLTDEHRRRIGYLYSEFYRRQLDITNVDERTLATLNAIPTLRDVIRARNSAGVNLHFLTDAGRYQYVRDLHAADRIVPMLGNLTSAETVERVNALLATYGERLATVYLSNAEDHILQRYTIVGQRGLTVEHNPQGLLDGPYGSAYDTLIDNLARLRTEPEAVLIRFFFPGQLGGRSIGVFPHLECDVKSLPGFLRRIRTDRPRSIFETYL
jgi:hypothetical protein